MRRERALEAAGLRQLLIAELHELQARRPPGAPDYHAPMLAELESGGPVILADWQVPSELRPFPPGWASGVLWYRLEPDERLTPLPGLEEMAPA